MNNCHNTQRHAKQKIENFIHENDITQLNKDPTESFQKQMQQTIQKCNVLIERKQ